MSGSDGLIPFLSSLEEEIWGGNNRQVSWLMARAPLAPFPGFPSGLDNDSPITVAGPRGILTLFPWPQPNEAAAHGVDM